MKVGDLIKRKIEGPIDIQLSNKTGMFGIVIRKSKSKIHSPSISVFWPKPSKVLSISERFVVVVK